VVCAFYCVTPEERQLLETTARSVLKLKEEILERVTGVEAVLHALFLSKGRTDIALARLRVLADLLAMKGTPSAYLSSFLARNQVDNLKLDVSSEGGDDGHNR
jgi:hypothetical protein